MKKRILIGFFILVVIFSFANISAEACALDVTLLNQDPYPAIPGEYVEIVFQINGIENPECGTVVFELLEKYPISFDPNTNPIITIKSGTFKRDYSSFLMAPYRVRVDSSALDGNNPIEVQYKYANNENYETKQLNLNIKDVKADFEIYIKNYIPSTKELTFEILNTAKSDVEALTIEIPKQDTIEVYGAKTNIVGDLDSNEYTTADFTAVPKEGEIKLDIYYTDSTNARRHLEKTVLFEPEYFKEEAESTSTTTYVVVAIVIVIIIYFFYRKHKKKKLKEQQKHRR